MQNKTRIGIVGTGFIATGLFHIIHQSEDFAVTRILTRRRLDSIKELPEEILTNSLDDFLENVDIVYEASGDVMHATDTILAATASGIRVVTINSEFHVTAGSYFAKKGHYVTESDGDQPGCLARLKMEIEGMGFEPVAYVNLKGFLNPNPTLEEMKYWSEKQQLALSQVVSFTDGTKLQIEQTLVANGLGATIAQEGMFGATVDTLFDLDYMVRAYEECNQPISEYVLCKGSPPGVLIVAKNKEADRRPGYLPFTRMRTTENLAYVLLRPYHLCHLEALNTLRRVVRGEPVLLNNSTSPTITVGAVAKQRLRKGDTISLGAGGFDVRGKAIGIKGHENAVPICLLKNTRIIRDIEPDQLVGFDDVDMEQSNALRFYLEGIKSTSI